MTFREANKMFELRCDQVGVNPATRSKLSGAFSRVLASRFIGGGIMPGDEMSIDAVREVADGMLSRFLTDDHIQRTNAQVNAQLAQLEGQHDGEGGARKWQLAHEGAATVRRGPGELPPWDTDTASPADLQQAVESAEVAGADRARATAAAKITDLKIENAALIEQIEAMKKRYLELSEPAAAGADDAKKTA